jgi:hypothetical protein
MRRLLRGLFCLGALLGITACGSTARVSQDNSSQQQVTVLTPAGQMSTMRCDGKGPKDTWFYPSLADVPFPALVEGVTHTTSAQGNASFEQWDACTAALSPTGVRAYYTTGMTANTWQTNAAFPDKGDTSTPFSKTYPFLPQAKRRLVPASLGMVPPGPHDPSQRHPLHRRFGCPRNSRPAC